MSGSADIGDDDRPEGAAGHQLVAHTADVIVEAWGPTFAHCAAESARGLIETYAELPLPAPVRTVEVVLEDGDELAALESLLEEVIFLLDTEEDVPVGCRVGDGDPRTVAVISMAHRADVRPTGSVPKAISRSDLELLHGDEVRCRFIVDV